MEEVWVDPAASVEVADDSSRRERLRVGSLEWGREVEDARRVENEGVAEVAIFVFGGCAANYVPNLSFDLGGRAVYVSLFHGGLFLRFQLFYFVGVLCPSR